MAAFMSGGKPFPLERLIAIFEAILDSQRSYSIGTTSILSSVKTLLNLRLLLGMKASGSSGGDKGELEGVRLRCSLSRDEVEGLALGLGWREWKERLVGIDD
ncbi:hypothetical protein JCM5353_002114 [Sporobolomyces roseus]